MLHSQKEKTDNKEPATSRQAGSVVPTISLSKGGGAIRGIDEKFTANPVTGTGSLNIPIRVSPSRSNFSPQLSLSYDSGSGNGPFGFGWGVSVPAITRKADKGLPRYQDENDSDTFILSEAEDLVPALKEHNGSWIKDAFELMVGAVQCKIQRYRPRVEGLFAQIERITIDGEAGCYWKMTTKDNVVIVYGRTASARIADPKDPSRIFKWLAEWSYDNKGNCFEYSYEAENLDQVPNTVNEKNRRSGLAPITNKYLKRVRYGNKNPYYPGVANPYWDSLKKGLLSGEKLQFDLRKLDIVYTEQNRREIELTKHTLLWLSRIRRPFCISRKTVGVSSICPRSCSIWIIRGITSAVLSQPVSQSRVSLGHT